MSQLTYVTQNRRAEFILWAVRDEDGKVVGTGTESTKRLADRAAEKFIREYVAPTKPGVNPFAKGALDVKS